MDHRQGYPSVISRFTFLSTRMECSGRVLLANGPPRVLAAGALCPCHVDGLGGVATRAAQVRLTSYRDMLLGADS